MVRERRGSLAYRNFVSGVSTLNLTIFKIQELGLPSFWKICKENRSKRKLLDAIMAGKF